MVESRDVALITHDAPAASKFQNRIVRSGVADPVDLIPNEHNFRMHPDPQRAAMSAVLNEIGWVQQVIVNERTGHIVDGHLRVELALMAGERSVPVDFVDLTEHEEKLILATFDPITSMALLNADTLTDLLDGLTANTPDLNKMLDALREGADEMLDKLIWDRDDKKEKSRGHGDPNRVPGIPADPISVRGDVWHLGDHRLMCGDSTNAADVDILMGPATASLCVTSPPYGVGKEYESRDINEWAFLITGFTAVWAKVAPIAVINLADIRCGPNSREVHTYGQLIEAAKRAGWPLIGTRIWVKPPAWNMPYYAHSYRGVDDWEYIGFFGEAPYVSRVENDWRYRGTWDFSSVNANKEHPAMFPVELPIRAMQLLTEPGQIVVDPFMGSGTTMIAAQQLGRVAYGMEMNPLYVDVAVKRWEDYTGEQAHRRSA